MGSKKTSSMVTARKGPSSSLNVNFLFDILTFVHFTSYQFVLRVFDSQSETPFLLTFVPCLPLPGITLSLSAVFKRLFLLIFVTVSPLVHALYQNYIFQLHFSLFIKYEHICHICKTWPQAELIDSLLFVYTHLWQDLVGAYICQSF